MDTMEYTFSTQRYDPRLKRQLSSISGTTPSAIHSRPSFLSLRPPTLMIKEPPREGSPRPSRALSSKSSDPASSRWCEGNSGGYSTLVNTEFSEDLLSHSGSAISFHLSADERPLPGKDGRGVCLKEKQVLDENLVSAVQVEAHIPPPVLVDNNHRGTNEAESDEGESDNDIRGQVRLVSSFTIRSTEGNEVHESLPLVKPRCASEPTYSSRRPHRVHPEYDSEYDDDTDSAESVPTSSFGFAEDEVDDGGFLESRDASASPGPNNTYSSLNSIAHPNPSLPTPCLSSSPIPSRPANPTTLRATVLSDIYEEESPAVESTPRIPVSSNSSYPESLLPMEPAPLLHETPVSSPASSSMEDHVWWRAFPRRRRAASNNSRSENNDDDEIRLESRELTPSSQGLRPQIGGDTSPSPRQDTRVTSAEVKEDKRHHIPPLPQVPPCCFPLKTIQYRRTKSRVRKVLSVMFPCILVPGGGKEVDEKRQSGSAQQADESSRTAGIGTAPTSHWLMTKRKEEPKGGLVKRSSALEVRVERQTSRIVDYHSS